MNDKLKDKLNHIWEQDGIFIIVQSLQSLQFNILEHVLVPPHRILTNDEILEVKKKYYIKNDTEFPEISRFDPVAQFIGMRPGQICEIIRPSKTAIKSLYYRICV
jgi:DNA-directed RNA polymerase subunit H (RpoH/RPB5)